MGRLSRPETEILQSRDRRFRDADDRHLHPVTAEGFKTARYRATDATVFAAIEGKGRTRIGDQVFEWGARDLFVVPSWHWVTHEADTDAVLFCFSDRPVQQKLDLFREDRGNA